MNFKYNSISDSQSDTISGKDILLSCSLLCLIIVAVYWNVLNSGFVNYDDPLYLLDRPEVKNGLTLESIRWAFTSTTEGNWIPLSWLSYMLDVNLFGITARGHHAVNLLFHIVNTFLLLLFMYRVTNGYWRSFFVAALFALHPLHVESVAWIAERKDVLSGCFFMFTLLAYQAYFIKPSVSRYLVVVVVFTLGLCSKSMLVTIPFLMLVLDFWPLGRLNDREKKTSFANLFVEKIPFFCLAFASSFITFIAQKRIGAVLASGQSTQAENISNALVSYVLYIYKTFVPLSLAVVYPFPPEIPLWQPLLAALLLSAATIMVVRFRRDTPYLLAGWLWFVGILLPVSGVIKLGDQAMADRYTYISLIGLFIMLVWGGASVVAAYKIPQRIMFVAATVVTGLLCVLSWIQVGQWRDSITLFRHAISVTDNNWIAYNKLAGALGEKGSFGPAFDCANESLRINPRNPFVYITLGLLYRDSFNYQQAISYFVKAVEISPSNENAHFLLGSSFMLNGDVGGAMSEYNILLGLNSERADMLLNGIIQMQQMRR